MGTYREYRDAAALLWGEAGEYAVGELARLNREHFAGSVPPLPVIIGLTAYGRCIGATLHPSAWLKSPRITLASEIFNGSARCSGGRRQVSDVLVHEMAHAALIMRGEDAKHNGEPWCTMITDLSPGVLGREITAAPSRPVRIPNPDRAADPSAPKTIVARRTPEGALSQAGLATWPHSARPGSWYDGDTPLPVPWY